MEYKDYAKLPGIASHEISDFFKSHDHCLLPKKGYKASYMIGTAFESFLDNSWPEKYFVIPNVKSIPDEIYEWIQSGEPTLVKQKLTKKGEPDKRCESRHNCIKSVIDSGGKIPVTPEDFNMLLRMRFNMLKVEIPMLGLVSDLLPNMKAQEPLQWESDGLRKKGLADFILHIPGLWGNQTFVLDTKTTKDFGEFEKRYGEQYWVQDCHYCEGAAIKAREIGSDVLSSMIFLVASKEPPYLCRSYSALSLPPKMEELELRHKQVTKYRQTCLDYQAWVDKGRKPCGVLPHKKLWINGG